MSSSQHYLLTSISQRRSQRTLLFQDGYDLGCHDTKWVYVKAYPLDTNTIKAYHVGYGRPDMH